MMGDTRLSPEFKKILEYVERGFSGIRVLVIGDLMLDRYILGDVDRISPEAPVPVLRHVDRYARPGGAANVAMNLAGLECSPILLGFWGNDPEQAELAGLLREHCIDIDGIVTTALPTISKTRIVAHRQQLVRLDIEGTEPYTQPEVDLLQARAVALVPEVDAVVLSDYAKGALVESLCQAVIEAARAAGVPVLVDPKSRDFGKYAGATTICPNLGELVAATGVPAADSEGLLQAARQLIAAHDLEFVTVTRSKDGITLVKPGETLHSPARAREVFDVSGAGDTVIATLAASLAKGVPLPIVLELANLAAGIVVGKVGTAPIALHEIVSELTASARVTSTEKILDQAQLARRVHEWRAGGETIVFTNGCFDLLHVGHISLFEECARLGSRLIVGLNGDDSIRRLKGPQRPIVGQNERARLVAALAAIDAVTLFHEDTPLELIRLIAPDVLVKGGDYTVDTIVGHQEVLAAGGKVEVVPIVEGFSTSAIVRKLTAEQSGDKL
ncbi:MAG TPA: bifunctional D-glycero-beta-D-manno-heptose-7-phosphate kinase/D-glycero-beta-D-manno-heptose 1-phosphate adenylyltransferase HldE [Acidobacteriaceae bacterium]